MYTIATLLVFIISIGICFFSYVRYNSTVNYWGNEWQGSIWFNQNNKNIKEIRFSKSEPLVISKMDINEVGYDIEFYRGSEIVNLKFIKGKSFVYNIDNATGGVLIGGIDDLLRPQGGSIFVTYYKSIDSSDLIIENIFL